MCIRLLWWMSANNFSCFLTNNNSLEDNWSLFRSHMDQSMSLALSITSKHGKGAFFSSHCSTTCFENSFKSNISPKTFRKKFKENAATPFLVEKFITFTNEYLRLSFFRVSKLCFSTFLLWPTFLKYCLINFFLWGSFNRSTAPLPYANQKCSKWSLSGNCITYCWVRCKQQHVFGLRKNGSSSSSLCCKAVKKAVPPVVGWSRKVGDKVV